MYNMPNDLTPLSWYRAEAIAKTTHEVIIQYKTGYVVYIPYCDKWIGGV